MSIVLYHHPFSRAANVIWMLEEAGVPYDVRFIDIMKGAHKAPEIVALNPMGKLPILTDGDAVISESAAIGIYLADRYAPGRLAPALDDPRRGTYLRWSLFAPSVIEPGSMAKAAGWSYKPGQAGWGDHEAMLSAITVAIGAGPWLLGETFSMADVIFGGTVRYMLTFGMLEPRPVFTSYAERIAARPALQKSDARNAAIAEANGLKRPG
ncbi:MAG: glutathione S-transferase family protein [Deltaproteobacteria bacterium]|nr:glutathione S-transferase family protein [Deltaproteobacteria bacterium]